MKQIGTNGHYKRIPLIEKELSYQIIGCFFEVYSGLGVERLVFTGERRKRRSSHDINNDYSLESVEFSK